MLGFRINFCKGNHFFLRVGRPNEKKQWIENIEKVPWLARLDTPAVLYCMLCLDSGKNSKEWSRHEQWFNVSLISHDDHMTYNPIILSDLSVIIYSLSLSLSLSSIPDIAPKVSLYIREALVKINTIHNTLITTLTS